MWPNVRKGTLFHKIILFKSLFFNRSPFCLFLKVNEIWYPERATCIIELLGEHISLTSCTKGWNDKHCDWSKLFWIWLWDYSLIRILSIVHLHIPHINGIQALPLACNRKGLAIWDYSLIRILSIVHLHT